MQGLEIHNKLAEGKTILNEDSKKRERTKANVGDVISSGGQPCKKGKLCIEKAVRPKWR